MHNGNAAVIVMRARTRQVVAHSSYPQRFDDSQSFTFMPNAGDLVEALDSLYAGVFKSGGHIIAVQIVSGDSAWVTYELPVVVTETQETSGAQSV